MYRLVRGAWLSPVGLIVAGGVLVTIAVLQGRAQVALVVIVPVVFGGSLEFVAGVLLLVAGLFLLPWTFERMGSSLPPGGEGSTSTAESGTAGLVLIGPVPIFFGSWRSVSRRTRVTVVVLGAVALTLAVLALVLYRA
ncbi:MAG: TIGR00304 family membrane protein [Thermoplasmata archaeon]